MSDVLDDDEIRILDGTADRYVWQQMTKRMQPHHPSVEMAIRADGQKMLGALLQLRDVLEEFHHGEEWKGDPE